ncbi:hypothetical protein SLEP1_g28382 [Rubroshorea leprosula]|uniref:Protein kinase domain-containing protein n=1 Tax=Rubroshorea leprosula TaxID=152421 RepID=A0AAV5K2Y1_9ROSI|nr:hypothetical protein SLEP1_g28382 [Rubroshorea leprosula]
MKIAFGVAKGLEFLHESENPVIYRDFKASNILLDSDYKAKLSDFGLAKDGPEGDDTHDCGAFGASNRKEVCGEEPPSERTEPGRVARPMLNDPRKLNRLMDPRLEGQYSESGVRMAAALAYQCVSHRAKHRPTMSTVVKILEPLQECDDIPIGTFVYVVPMGSDIQKKSVRECETKKEAKEENSHHRHHHQKSRQDLHLRTG